MLEVPTQDSIERFDGIPLWISPPGTQVIVYHKDNLPSKEELRTLGWVEVIIGVTPERLVKIRGGIQAKRLQYSLKHIGAITINKSQGETLPSGLAVEITEEFSPWEKGHIFVCVSRTRTANLTVIVGEQTFAIQKMWELITLGNQWTAFSEKVLRVITINSLNDRDDRNVIDYPAVYPFRLNDGVQLPTDTTGFIYCLVSRRYTEEIYIGQTECLCQRYLQHNQGTGSISTENIRLRPWAVAAYICGLNGMSKRDRMSLEGRWKWKVQELQHRGYNDSFSWINAGSDIVRMYNVGQQTDQIHYVRLISPND